MAELKLINELGYSAGLMALEPAKVCAARCGFCYVRLNRRKQWGGKKPDLTDPGTFESTVERAFGLDYDPTDFKQWIVRNRVPITYATGVEPFQDVPQAASILKTCDQLDLPLFVQARGLNWREVWPLLKARAGNIAAYVSLPTDDDRVLKRFEPGTPLYAERRAYIDALVGAGIPVVVAIAPYHPDWLDSMPRLAAEAVAWGASHVFFDVLHLDRAQLETATDPALAKLVESTISMRVMDQAAEARAVVLDAGRGWLSGFEPMLTAYNFEDHGDSNPHPYRNALDWPYQDRRIFSALEAEIDYDDDDQVYLLTWGEALKLMERGKPVEQRFRFNSINDLLVVKKLPPAWQDVLRPTATMADHFRAQWNEPNRQEFAWSHPMGRLAVRPDGRPWLDDAGNVVMAFAPHLPCDYEPIVVESFDDAAFFVAEDEPESEPEGKG